MERPSLGNLPEELLLAIIEHLDTARDVAHLGALTKTTHSVVERDGWCAFIKTHFPSLNFPVNDQTKWSDVANRATYLHRCWERRGLFVDDFHENRPGRPNSRRRRQTRPFRPQGQSVSFRTVLDAKLSPNQQDEVLAAGVGEDLLIRMKPYSGKGKGKDLWKKIQGKDYGYKPGTGDVTAVSVIERHGMSCVIAGRANGDIQLLSAEDDLARAIQNLSLDAQAEQNRESNPMRKSPGQIAVSWTEWDPQSHLLASSKGSLLALHDLSTSEDDTLAPIANHDFFREHVPGEPSLVRGVKFMSKDVVAIALGGSRSPLCWGNILPTGIEFHDAMTKPSNHDGTTPAEFGASERTTVRAIEPVRGGGSNSLLLSAWDDGTYRLMDIRTPSPYDAFYRDGFLPNEGSGSLLVYGTERFITGGFHGTVAAMHFFDFRWPKTYYDSSTLPCSNHDAAQPFADAYHQKLKPLWTPKGSPSRCDYQAGTLCHWHGQSRLDYYRPDTTIRVLADTYDNIFSLTKASDLSESFYCGVGGGILEMNWRLHQDVPSYPRPSAPEGWYPDTFLDENKLALLETGVGLCESYDEDNLGTSAMPTVHIQRRRGALLPRDRYHRLDASFLIKPRHFGYDADTAK
ncbi:hypothetical protein B0T10DRAFT_558405 [Thelonectria olida]|uniref:F-box domain-containing protein n=1 Tax=Thelonectria olida TaxID=1576542 RepID=A0A9P8W9R9_9HYPO|nr:hypothetical protein B0T10DRAFT_558405 [Thelonectria olida]